MFFMIGLVVIFSLFVILIFAYQKIYNPGQLCRVCYRVVPEMVFVNEIDEEDGGSDYYVKCPFCDSELEWGD